MFIITPGMTFAKSPWPVLCNEMYISLSQNAIAKDNPFKMHYSLCTMWTVPKSRTVQESSEVPYIRIIHSFSSKGNIFYREQFQNQANLLIKHYPFLFLKGKCVLEWKHLFVLVCNGCYCAVWHNLRIVYWLSLESSIAICFKVLHHISLRLLKSIQRSKH